MIKDKITPELKKRFLDELRISKETGNERGFVICVDEKENLTASDSCTRDHCTIDFGDIREKCPTGILKKSKEQEGVLIERWVDSVFDREIIDLSTQKLYNNERLEMINNNEQ